MNALTITKPQKPQIGTVFYDVMVFGRGGTPATGVYIEKNAKVTYKKYTLKLIIAIETDGNNYEYEMKRRHNRKPFHWNKWGYYPIPGDPLSLIWGQYDPSLLIDQIESGRFNVNYLRGNEAKF